MRRRILAVFIVASVASAGAAFADVQLPGIISDHMLLQRGVPARIFGKAEPGEAVSVTFRGQTAQTVTDSLGSLGALAQAARRRTRRRHDDPGREHDHDRGRPRR